MYTDTTCPTDGVRLQLNQVGVEVDCGISTTYLEGVDCGISKTYQEGLDCEIPTTFEEGLDSGFSTTYQEGVDCGGISTTHSIAPSLLT